MSCGCSEEKSNSAFSDSVESFGDTVRERLDINQDGAVNWQDFKTQKGMFYLTAAGIVISVFALIVTAFRG